MKRTYLLWASALLLILGSMNQSVQAQCTPDPNATGLVSPDTLPTACPNQFYDVTLTLSVPTDTTIGLFTVDIDSVVLTSVLGLPTGLSTSCNPVSCGFPGGTQGCVRVFGTPTDTGEFSIDIVATVFFKVLGSPQNISDTLPTDQTLIVGLTADAASTDATCNDSDGTATVIMTSGSGPYNFSWNDSQNQTDSVATGLAAGLYMVQVTDATGCVGNFEVNVNNDGGAVIDSAASTIGWLGCHDEDGGFIKAFVVGGQSPYTFSWSTGEDTVDIDDLSEGMYSLTVTDNLGCTTIQDFEVEAPNPVVVSTTMIDSVDCFGGADGSASAIAVGGQGDFLYSWDTDPVTNAAGLTNQSAGTYTLTVEDELGCIRTLEVDIFEPDTLEITFDITKETVTGAMDGGASTTITGGTGPFTYSWSSGSDSSALAGVSEGSYTLTVTDVNGCVTVDSVLIGNIASIEDLAGIQDYRLYPNPAAQELTLQLTLNQVQPLALRLYDLQGRLMQTEAWSPAQSFEAELDLKGLAPGLYLLSLQVGDYQVVRRFMKE
ncbi:MAG: T9SS type A sorting domain-containing protein [Bacteroidota bacterium]